MPPRIQRVVTEIVSAVNSEPKGKEGNAHHIVKKAVKMHLPQRQLGVEGQTKGIGCKQSVHNRHHHGDDAHSYDIDIASLAHVL